jgi:hypothetical protein
MEALKLKSNLTEIEAILSFNQDGKSRASIPFRKELFDQFGSIESALLFQQIIYCWHSFGRKPFYMFFEPCKDDLYDEQKGNSWLDLLGLSKFKANNALKAFAKKTRRNDLSESMKAGKTPVWYYTDRLNHTYFVVDERATLKLLDEAFGVKRKTDKEPEKPSKPEKKTESPENKPLSPPKSINLISGNEADSFRYNSKIHSIDLFKDQPPIPPKNPDENKPQVETTSDDGMDGIFKELNRVFQKAGRSPSDRDRDMLRPILDKFGADKCIQAIRNCATMPLSDWRNKKARGSVSTIFKSEATFENWLNYSVGSNEHVQNCYIPPAFDHPRTETILPVITDDNVIALHEDERESIYRKLGMEKWLN